MKIDKQKIISIFFILLSFILIVGGIKNLYDKNLFEITKILSTNYDLGLLVASYFGTFVIPICLFLIGRKISNDNRNIIYSLFILGILVVVILLFRFWSTQSNWLPITKYSQGGFMYRDQIPRDIKTYIDLNSLKNKDGLQYLKIAHEFNPKLEDGSLTVIWNAEIDCSGIPKYRNIEISKYSSGIEQNLGKKIFEDKEFQRSFANLMVENGQPYTGGWTSLNEIRADRIQCKIQKDLLPAERDTCSRAESEFAILNGVCTGTLK